MDGLVTEFIDELHIITDEKNESVSLEMLTELEEQIRVQEDELRSLYKRRDEMKEKLSFSSFDCPEIICNDPLLIGSKINLQNKADLLFDLFRGRRDVYAVRNPRGYYPKCSNWGSYWCPRKEKGEKIRCIDCPNSKFVVLTSYVIRVNHLCNHDSEGNGAIGIYPMLPGNKCRFAAIDLDEATWKHDSLCVASVARRAGFQIAIEISFSGNGAHLWLFFSEEIPARNARKLMMSFLDGACRMTDTVSIKSYDRIFPAQDTVKDGGIGNLILMPLVLSASARQEKDKGTVFVDNSFTPYSDQFAFLSSLPKYSNRDIDAYLRIHERESIPLFDKKLSEPDPLWNCRLPKLSSSDSLVPVLPVYLSAGISIPKKYITPAFIDCIRRMASYRDPEYYRALERNKGYISKDLCCFITLTLESDSVIQLPRGFLNQFKALMKKSCITTEIIDLRKSETGLDVTASVFLRKEQIAGIEAMRNSEIGIVRAATSYGKTVLAAEIIAERKERTLIIVNSKQLMEQWQQKLESYLTVNNPPEKRPHKRINKTGIGLFGGQKDSVTGLIDIATAQSIASSKPLWVRDYGLVIVDECHHAASDQYRDILSMVRPKYLYGLTATDKRKDGHEKSVYALCGSVIFTYDADRLAYERGLMQVFIPRFMNTVYIPSSVKRNCFHEIVKALSEDQLRNSSIAEDAVEMMDAGHKVLILTALTDHAEKLYGMISDKGKYAILIHGKTKESDKILLHKEISEKPNGGVIIISTISYLGEGTDIPYLDTLMLASPVSWKGLLSQTVGRICRISEGKKTVTVFDYVDVHMPECLSMYHKRVSAYGKLGFMPSGAASEVKCDSVMYRKDTYEKALMGSIRCARLSVEISCPVLGMNFMTSKVLELLHIMTEKGVNVIVHSKKINKSDNHGDETAAWFRSLGIELVYEEFPVNYAVIDSSEVWFGDICILYPEDWREDQMMIHFTSSDVAKHLTGPDDLFSVY